MLYIIIIIVRGHGEGQISHSPFATGTKHSVMKQVLTFEPSYIDITTTLSIDKGVTPTHNNEVMSTLSA